MRKKITLDHTDFSAQGLLQITWPALLELCLAVGIGIIGTLLAARISDHAGAAFSLANQLATLLFILFKVIGAGLSISVAQTAGRGRHDVAAAIARAALAASTWIGGGIAVLALIGAAPLLKIMQAPSEVLPLALPFLQTLAPAMLLDAWNSVMAAVLRAHLRVRAVLGVIALMQVAHVGIALCLMPTMGLLGFALALVISRAVGFIVYLLLWRAQLNLLPVWRDWWQWRTEHLLPVLRIGVPGAAAELAYRLAFTVSVAAVAQLGAQNLATQAYTLQINFAVLLFGLATSVAVEILMGRLIGAGRLRDAHQLLLRALAIGLTLCLVLSICAALNGAWLLGRFSHDAGIIQAGSQLLWLTILLEPGRTLNLILNSALRASGDARYPVQAGLPSMLLVLAAGSWFFAVTCGLGIAGIWIAYAADEWIRGLLMWRRWLRLAWVPRARLAYRRLKI